MKLATCRGWTLSACHDGERITLHVEDTKGRGASLACAIDTGEVADKRGGVVAINQTTAELFDRWMEMEDIFLAKAGG
jgi:hypothetical protein